MIKLDYLDQVSRFLVLVLMILGWVFFQSKIVGGVIRLVCREYFLSRCVMVCMFVGFLYMLGRELVVSGFCFRGVQFSRGDRYQIGFCRFFSVGRVRTYWDVDGWLVGLIEFCYSGSFFLGSDFFVEIWRVREKGRDCSVD